MGPVILLDKTDFRLWFIEIYRSIILPVVLYGCETWSLTFREGRKLWVFQNMVLSGIFGSRSDEVNNWNGGDCISRS